MHYWLAVVSAFSSSITSVLGKFSYTLGATVTQILFLRFFFSFLIALVLFMGFGYKFKFKKFFIFGSLGIVNYGIAAYSFFLGLQYLSPAYATVVYFTNPIFVSLLQTKTTNRKLNFYNAVAVGLSFAGVLIANMGEKAFLQNESLIFGTIMVLFAAFVNALFVVTVSENIKTKYPNPLENSFYTFLGTFIYYFILMSITNGFETLSSKFLLSGFLLAVFATFVPLTLNYFALKKLQSHTLALLMPLELIFASVLSAIFLSEQFNVLKVLGFLMVASAPIIDITSIESQESNF
ncbi:UAA transporter family protein [Marinitoga sp. 1135]|uniref:Putative permease, DMT superfamily n=1 Tax=Marinitoga piezophila (strain DSM 14283 / JCM 11233 / KA3) TaxID=443254 RepID=H2J3N7_MARPK|nr:MULTISPECIES: DMT family transporter [Marinitoga]AEX84681.1 putative permease, DMT superfamily [Marinitoga piezophila KA3]APT75208.1 UAA transporter family protein [Marinitoga sp. 1137]NUU94990.1 UAA transporter family protein [Marinitoga sp. 1135]NUU96946.1 UAA transporter family protein [Marinitoga sp. 1138]